MIDKRRLADDVCDLMIRLLHYQERGEPKIENVTYAQSIRLPDDILQRYRSDPVFHAQVQRAVSSVLLLVSEAERGAPLEYERRAAFDARVLDSIQRDKYGSSPQEGAEHAARST